MNLPTELTLKALLADTDLLAKIRRGELVARVRGDTRRVVDVYYLREFSRHSAYVDWADGDGEYGYGVQKRVVISDE